MPILLSPEQREVVSELSELIDHKPKQTLGGLAGTGKTVCTKELKRRHPKFAVCAFTGKAANVLRRKGVQASTIHSLIYKAVEVERIDSKGRAWKETKFVLRQPFEVAGNGFLVDEASMVTKRLHDDLLSFRRPVIFVGDHGQLPPVGDDFNLMVNPDYRLETIHRNAGPIAHFAKFIRDGEDVKDWTSNPHSSSDAVQVVPWSRIAELQGNDPDQLICAYNDTRIALNKFVREGLGLPPDQPVVGDRVMVLQNKNGIGLFNGMQGTIDAIWRDELVFDSQGQQFRVPFYPNQFNSAEKPKFSHGDRVPFDFCYAITAHKSQGDEWPYVLVIEQRCRLWEHARWAYTAASRARQRLTWVPEIE
jgi:exodeoxyribonuclease V